MHSLVVVGYLVVEISAMTEHSDAHGFCSRDPLVNGSSAVVEIPGHNESDRIRTQRVKTIENDAGLDAGHNWAGHAKFSQSDTSWNDNKWKSLGRVRCKNQISICPPPPYNRKIIITINILFPHAGINAYTTTVRTTLQIYPSSRPMKSM